MSSTLDRIINKAKKHRWFKSLTKKYNKLDKEVTDVMLKAGKNMHTHHHTYIVMEYSS